MEPPRREGASARGRSGLHKALSSEPERLYIYMYIYIYICIFRVQLTLPSAISMRPLPHMKKNLARNCPGGRFPLLR